MNERIEQLTNLLLEQNESLAYEQARTWIELLWDDFETTSAKAGHQYMGPEMAERIVTSWINRYGAQLHEFVASNPKYEHLLNRDDYTKH
ncbi:YfhJ family protein [Bacillus suaedaesalsae]|uniref:YfhJ family protein n=1 Tax=Bacillus suaedaesalsae TaxID=2810349 RepID=A0ABS2DDC8_9BACI|nr:YfhJ family protein [Bacillus suaedaesalsae]MBM6616463.1 YfhJ family protein [Bacillus suaedaesalsae]